MPKKVQKAPPKSKPVEEIHSAPIVEASPIKEDVVVESTEDVVVELTEEEKQAAEEAKRVQKEHQEYVQKEKELISQIMQIENMEKGDVVLSSKHEEMIETSAKSSNDSIMAMIMSKKTHQESLLCALPLISGLLKDKAMHQKKLELWKSKFDRSLLVRNHFQRNYDAVFSRQDEILTKTQEILNAKDTQVNEIQNSYRNELERMRGIFDGLQNENSQLKKQLGDFIEYNNRRDEQQGKQGEQVELQKKIQVILEKERDILTTENQNLQGLAGRLQQENTILKGQGDIYSSKFNELKGMIDESTKEYRTTVNQLQKKVVELENERMTSLKAQTELQQRLLASLQQANDFKTKYGDSNQKVVEIQAKFDKLQGLYLAAIKKKEKVQAESEGTTPEAVGTSE